MQHAAETFPAVAGVANDAPALVDRRAGGRSACLPLHERDICRMGGLWLRMPLAFITFLIGSASLAGLPLVTAGFYSKDLILWQTWASAQGSYWLWAAGVVGAFLTALYSFRLVFRVFCGRLSTPVSTTPRWRIRAVLVLLALLSLVGGWLEVP